MTKPTRGSAEPPRGVHDLGGLAAGQIDAHEHTPTLTERRIDAMMMLMRDKKRNFWTTDENRRTIEQMTPSLYEGTGYYERWVLAMRGLFIEKGILAEDEIAARLSEVRTRYQGAATAAHAASAGTATKAPSKPAVKKASRSKGGGT